MYKEEGKIFYCLGFENNIVEISGLLYLLIFFACLKNYSQGLLFFFLFPLFEIPFIGCNIPPNASKPRAAFDLPRIHVSMPASIGG